MAELETEEQRAARRAALSKDLDDQIAIAKQQVKQILKAYEDKGVVWQKSLMTFLRIEAEAAGNKLGKKVIKLKL